MGVARRRVGHGDIKELNVSGGIKWEKKLNRDGSKIRNFAKGEGNP